MDSSFSLWRPTHTLSTHDMFCARSCVHVWMV
uniref:Uncharacterized protein n=1 Tax=Anguilla anguilla TaxID=7936 RepID=A0A0E9VZ64_ANGAN